MIPLTLVRFVFSRLVWSPLLIDSLVSVWAMGGAGGGGEGAWLDGIISLKLAELFQPFFSIECIKFALVSIYFKAEHTLSRQTELWLFMTNLHVIIL